MSSDITVYERYKHIPENVWQREGESDEAWFHRINPNGPPLRDTSVKFLRGQGECKSAEVWRKKFHKRLDERIRRKRSSQAQVAPPTNTDPSTNSTPPVQSRENNPGISSAAAVIRRLDRGLENVIPASVSRPTLVERPVSPPTNADSRTLETVTAPTLSASSLTPAIADALPVTLDFAARGSTRTKVSEESIVKTVQSMLHELLASKASEVARLSEEKALLARTHNDTWTELENTRRQLSQAASYLTNQKTEMQKTLGNTSAELEEAKEEIARLRDVVIESNGERDELKAEVKGLEVLLRNSQNDNKRLRDESARRQEEADGMVQDIENSVGRFNEDLDEMKKRFRICQEEAATFGLVESATKSRKID
ncbi:hypothetical protein VNI00_011277 [Paramarasmius palmivorus]|uniref:Uncharacterized protein n=1 Tax=Paramarasmius palmivorus TaxID=297713 RepID=A0AAW0CGK6_9AGAR